MRRAGRDDEPGLELAHRRQPRVFESAILDQLGIEAAIARVRDLLEEDAVEVGGNSVTGA
jgi:hypothetical protein